MGRNYYCEYCEKRMKDDLQIRKKHIEGLQHQAARSEHYAKYKDIKTVLEEESKKTPCSRFPLDQCKFGSYCRFSHYSREELHGMQLQVNEKEYQQWLAQQAPVFEDSTIVEFLRKRQETPIEVRDAVNKLWTYPDDLIKVDLPPSMQQINPKLLPSTFEEWGKKT